MVVKRVTPDEVKELLESDAGYVFIDVRTIPEFDAAHVPGAKNIPVFVPNAYGRMYLNPEFLGVVRANFTEDANIITGCQMGGRSLRAAEALLGSGFRSVVDMRGGLGGEMDPLGRVTFAGWATRGLPISSESRPEDRYEFLKAIASRAK